MSLLDRDCDRFHFEDHLATQRIWSEKTFGPGRRLEAVVDHIRQELVEVLESDGSLKEWVDIILLSCGGAMRSGGASPAQLIEALVEKLEINQKRKWPDWRTQDPNKAINHDRTGEQ